MSSEGILEPVLNMNAVRVAQIHFGDLVTEIYYFSLLNSKYSAQLRTIRKN